MKKEKCKWKINDDYINVYDLYKLRSVFNNLESKVRWYMAKKRLKKLLVESFKIIGII